MTNDKSVLASLGLVLSVAVAPAAAVVPEPPINGVVVQAFTQPFIFDQAGQFNDGGPPFVNVGFYQGSVEAKVIRAPDNTFDFYFRFDVTSGVLQTFEYAWQQPVDYVVSHHVQEPGLPWAPNGPSFPAPGTTASGATSFRSLWTAGEGIPSGGNLRSGVLVLDTDATAYARNATFQIGDSLNGMVGFYSGQSPVFKTFGPTAPVPEPETYALMLVGLGGIGWVTRRRHR